MRLANRKQQHATRSTSALAGTAECLSFSQGIRYEINELHEINSCQKPKTMSDQDEVSAFLEAQKIFERAIDETFWLDYLEETVSLPSWQDSTIKNASGWVVRTLR
jgi:hypothetical protein